MVLKSLRSLSSNLDCTNRVHDQITKVVTIMKLCDNMDDFRKKFSKLFNRSSQLEFTFSQLPPSQSEQRLG